MWKKYTVEKLWHFWILYLVLHFSLNEADWIIIYLSECIIYAFKIGFEMPDYPIVINLGL